MEGRGDKKKLVYKYLKGVYSANKDAIEKAANYFQSEWDEINDDVMADLSKILETKWETKQIRAQLTVTGVCGYDLDYDWFQVYYRSNAAEMKETAIHELIHLGYGKKWCEIFPRDGKSRFKMLDRVWALSEILVAPITNDERLKKHTGLVSKNSYKWYFGEVDMGGKKVILTDYFDNMYKELITKKRVPFSEFLKEARRALDQIRDKTPGKKLAV